MDLSFLFPELSKKLDKLIENKDNVSSTSIDILTKEITCLSQEITELKQKITKLSSIVQELNTINNHVSTKIHSNTNIKNESMKNKLEIIPELSAPAILYFGAPDSNGEFEVRKQIRTSKGEEDIDALYVISIKREKKGEAIFYPITKKNNRFKMNPAQLLNPVCEIVGDLSKSSFKILENGILTLNNEVWILKKKCKIQFY